MVASSFSQYNSDEVGVKHMASATSSDEKYMRLALNEARRSPPKATNFCVGALLVAPSSDEPILATGFTLEMPGNTHAEQSAFLKLAHSHFITQQEVEPHLGPFLPEDTVLYTTMEPCNKRSVGNTPCVDRILALRRADGSPAIGRVCVGVSEPERFVGVNEGRSKLEKAGILVSVIPGFEEEILQVATAGHEKG